MRIKVENAELVTEERVDKKTGECYVSRKQRASIENGTTYPLEFLLPLTRGAAPYAVGDYEVVGPFSSDRYGNLSVTPYMKLRPVVAAKAAPRAVPA